MKFVVITQDQDVAEAACRGFDPADECRIHEEWPAGLDEAGDADMLFVNLLATLSEPHKIAGYEEFAAAKMAHPAANKVPLVLIAPPDEYDLDFMAGWPDFVFAHLRRPITYKVFRRASTWI